MNKSNPLYKAVGLNWSNITFEVEDNARLFYYPVEMTSEEFLNFSKRDFRSKEGHGLINAFSNANRAIEAQVDRALRALGFARKDKAFSQKVEILKELDIATPDILTRVAEIRDYLEEYREPDEDDVKEAISVAASFIKACDRSLRDFQSAFAIGEPGKIRDGRYYHCILFRYDKIGGEFELAGCKDGEVVERIKIHPEDPEYKAILKLAFAIGRWPVRLEETLKSLQRIMSK